MSNPNPPPVPPRPTKRVRLFTPIKTKLPAPDKPEEEILPTEKHNIKLPGIATETLKLTPEQKNKRYFLQLEIINKGLELIYKRKLRSFADLTELLKHEETIGKLYQEAIEKDFIDGEEAQIALQIAKQGNEELTPVEELRIAECCSTCKFFIPENHCWLNRPKPTWNKKGLKGKIRNQIIADNYPEIHPWSVCDSYLRSGDKKRLRKLFKKFNLEKNKQC